MGPSPSTHKMSRLPPLSHNPAKRRNAGRRVRFAPDVVVHPPPPSPEGNPRKRSFDWPESDSDTSSDPSESSSDSSSYKRFCDSMAMSKRDIRHQNRAARQAADEQARLAATTDRGAGVEAAGEPGALTVIGDAPPPPVDIASGAERDGLAVFSKAFPHRNARPTTVLEVAAAWEIPKIQETVSAGSRKAKFKAKDESGKPKRYSLAPPHTSGDSEGTVDKTSLLAVIMANDPVLRQKGITIKLNDTMLHKRLKIFINMIDDKPSPNEGSPPSDRVKALCTKIEHANQVLRTEISTAETTSTGIMRATIYKVINDILADPYFIKAEYRDHIGRLVYGDPPTTTASIADVAGWATRDLVSERVPELSRARCRTNVEHKREVCLPDDDFGKMMDDEFKYDEDVLTNVLTIKLEGDDLVWSGMNGPSHTHLRRQITQASLRTCTRVAYADRSLQLITEMYSNKTSDAILFNTRCLRVLSRKHDISVFEMSRICVREAPRKNVEESGRVKAARKLVPTPVLVFLSILATGQTIQVENFPKTKFRREKKAQAPNERRKLVVPGWTEADDDEIPDLQEADADLNVVPISETPTDTGDAALPLLPVRLPKGGFFPSGTLKMSPMADVSSSPKSSALASSPSALQRGPTPSSTSGISAVGLLPEIDFHVDDLFSARDDRDGYIIKLNSPWRPAFAPTSPGGIRIVGTDAPRSSVTGKRHVVISDRIACGRLYTTYEGTLRDADCSEDDIDVVIRLAYPDRFPESHDPGRPHGHTFESARDAIGREASLYLNELFSLQGKVVPRFHGCFVNDAGVFAMVLGMGGDSLWKEQTKTFQSLSMVVNKRLPEMYRQLHQAGVIHKDLHLRHILKDPGSLRNRQRYWIIDFEGSIVPPRSRLQEYADGEMKRLESLLKDPQERDGLSAWRQPDPQ